MKRLFLTGGTGLLGKELLKQLQTEPFDITLGSRTMPSEQSDYKWKYFELDDKQSKLDLSEIEIVVHLASNTQNLSANSDLNGIKQLLKAVKRDQIKHLIFISIVGVDKIPAKYFKTKLKAEKLIQENCANYTIIRSTQFFPFFESEVQQKLKRKLALIPNLSYQPIEVSLVAQKIVELCKANPLNAMIEIGGDEMLSFHQAIKTYQRLMGAQSIIFPIPTFLLGKLGHALTTKQQLPNSKSWKTYLQEQIRSRDE